MFSPIVILAPTLHAARRAAAPRIPHNEKTLILGNTSGIPSGWRALLQPGVLQVDIESPQPIWQPRFSSLDEWFLEAATLAEAPLWSTRADRRFLLRAILPSLRGKLQLLHRLCRSNELVRQLDLLIADLRSSEHTNFSFSGDWSGDLELITGEYNRRLQEQGATDIESAPAIWADSQTQGSSSKIEHLVFDQIIAPSPVQWRGIHTLCDQSGSTHVALVMPWIETTTQGWDEVITQAENSALEHVLQKWQEAGADLEIIGASESDNEAQTEKQAAICALLSFRSSEPPPNLSLTSTHTPRDEMERVASSIRQRCSAPEALEESALVLPDAATYAGVLEPVFSAHGVPIRTRRARPHGSYPVVQRVLRLLQLHGGDWTLDEIADLFGDGLLRLCSGDEDAQNMDIHRLRAACFGSRMDAIRSDDECLERLQNAVQKEEQKRGGKTPVLDANVERDLNCIRRLRAACARLHEVRSAGEWRDEIFSVIEMMLGHLGFAWSTPEAKTRAQQQAVLQIEALRTAIENIASRMDRWQPNFLQGNNRDADSLFHSLPDFLFDCLRLELETATAPLEENPGAALDVVSPMRFLSDVPRHVYFAGLIEGAWPASHSPGTLLSRHRAELAPLRAHLPDAALLARYQLALAIVEAESVHLLHPTQNTGREVLRSPLLEDIALAWQGIPALPPAVFPTSRAALLQSLGEWKKAGGWQLVESQLSLSLRQALSVADVAPEDLSALLRVESERKNQRALGRYDGALGGDGAALLQEMPRALGREGEAISLSATRLKTYAQCPLKFFVRHILKVEPAAVWQDEPRGDQTGNLIHKILERFGKNFALPLTWENQNEAWFVLREIVLYALEQEGLRPMLREIEARRLLGNSVQTPGGMMGKMLLAQIAQRSGEEKKPAFCAPLVPLTQAEAELPSTFENGVELSFPLRFGVVHLEGRIDHILCSQDGQTLAIIDYKSGSTLSLPRFSDANWGMDFQLALYLLAVRAQLRFWRETSAWSTPEASTPEPRLVAAFFALRDGKWANGFGQNGTLGRNQTLKGPGAISHANGMELDAETFHLWLDATEKRIVKIGELLQQAQFNITIQDRQTSGCRFCEFKTGCRYDEAVSSARLGAAYDTAQRGREQIYLPLPLVREN